MVRRLIFAINVLCVIILCPALVHAGSQWFNLDTGITYRKVVVGRSDTSGTIHFFRIDPKKWKLQLIRAKQFGRSSATIKFLAQSAHTRLAINGGFFDANLEPLGLRISGGKQQNPIKPISWWGIFAIVLDKPQMFSFKEYSPSAQPDFAIQSGPRLVVAGRIPTTLKEGLDERAGIGATADGEIVFAITERAWITTTEFAQWMRSSEGGGCVNALNLDGGHSAQLYYEGIKGQMSFENTSMIVDAIGIYPR